mgnify:CR=1 FL=1
MFEGKPYFYGTGRRKSSVARVRVYQGTGKITINDRDIDDFRHVLFLLYVGMSAILKAYFGEEPPPGTGKTFPVVASYL